MSRRKTFGASWNWGLTCTRSACARSGSRRILRECIALTLPVHQVDEAKALKWIGVGDGRGTNHVTGYFVTKQSHLEQATEYGLLEGMQDGSRKLLARRFHGYLIHNLRMNIMAIISMHLNQGSLSSLQTWRFEKYVALRPDQWYCYHCSKVGSSMAL
jgi:hypothetical protein